MLKRQNTNTSFFSNLTTTSPLEMFSIFSSSTPCSPTARVPPLPACVCVWRSTDCWRCFRLHISLVSFELTPAPPVALLVCLPVAAVTEEVERARWLQPPQQTHCCCCRRFSIYGSVYIIQALSVCTAIKMH